MRLELAGKLNKLHSKWFTQFACPATEVRQGQELRLEDMAGLLLINVAAVLVVFIAKSVAFCRAATRAPEEEKSQDLVEMTSIGTMDCSTDGVTGKLDDDKDEEDEMALIEAKLLEMHNVLAEAQRAVRSVSNIAAPDPLLEPLLSKMVSRAFPRCEHLSDVDMTC